MCQLAYGAMPRIAGNLFAAFLSQSSGTEDRPDEPFLADMKVKIGKKFFYPDVLASIDLTLLVEDIYARVMNDEMRDHRKGD